MHVHSVDALVLRTYRYGEADRIVVFLTADRGKKRGVAKNATASRRRFGAALEPLTHGRATYVEREHRELVRLDRVEPIRTPFDAAAGRIDGEAAHRLSHAAYFAELLDEWSPDGQANERLFRLGTAVGEAMNGAGSIDALARYFEYWLMRLEGVYPALDRCPACGRLDMASGTALQVADRAYVCQPCANGGPRLSGEAMAFLRACMTMTPGQAATRPVTSPALRQLEEAHHRLIAAHLEKDVRSSRIVKELRPHP